jgi:hypothetical protein
MTTEMIEVDDWSVRESHLHIKHPISLTNNISGSVV